MTVIPRKRYLEANEVQTHSRSYAMITEIVKPSNFATVGTPRASAWCDYLQSHALDALAGIDTSLFSASDVYQGLGGSRIDGMLNESSDPSPKHWGRAASVGRSGEVQCRAFGEHTLAPSSDLGVIGLVESVRNRLLHRLGPDLVKLDETEFISKRDTSLIVSRGGAAASRFRWPNSAEEAVSFLEDYRLRTTDRDKAVLASTLYEYAGGMRDRFLAGLSRYINDYRFSCDGDRIIVVGGAIRSYALYMDEPEFEQYAAWMLGEPGKAISDDLTLELVKGICWRVQFEPLERRGVFPFLSKVVSLVANKYVDERFLSQGKWGAIGVNAVTALFLLGAVSKQDELADEAWSIAVGSHTSWFIEDLLSRLESAAGYISEHSEELASLLNEMIARICDEEAYRTCQHGG